MKTTLKYLSLFTLLTLISQITFAESSDNSSQACDAMIVSLIKTAQSLVANTQYCNSVEFTGPSGSLGYNQYYKIVESSSKLQDAYNYAFKAANMICPAGALMSDAALTGLHHDGIETHVGEITDGSSLNTCH